MSRDQGVWRWNSNITWHYVSSTQYSAYASKSAHDDFTRYHHLRTCLYFGLGALEAFSNERMRGHLDKQGSDDKEIVERLRKDTLEKKIKNWPSEIAGGDVTVGESTLKIIRAHQSIRDEITHPKRHDHSIYPELDSLSAEELVDAVTEYIVVVLEALGKPFPYWLLGWNYVGLNGNPAAVWQGNNGNGFAHSFHALGFQSFNPYDIDFEARYMMTLDHFRALKEALSKVTVDIEQDWPELPLKPRLTRRWWDADFIRSQVPTHNSP